MDGLKFITRGRKTFFGGAYQDKKERKKARKSNYLLVSYQFIMMWGGLEQGLFYKNKETAIKKIFSFGLGFVLVEIK